MTAVLVDPAKLGEVMNAGIASAAPSSTEPARRGALRTIDLSLPDLFFAGRAGTYPGVHDNSMLEDGWPPPVVYFVPRARPAPFFAGPAGLRAADFAGDFLAADGRVEAPLSLAAL